MSDKVTIAIISDLHCKYSSGKSQTSVNTYLTSDLMPLPVNRNPVEALKKVIKDQNLKADILLCPGDITDQIDKQGLLSGWKYLEDLKNAFQADHLAATIGNHDVDSRKKLGNDPFDLVQKLSPNFPTSVKTSNDHFWSNKFCLLNADKFDLLIFNSSYSHLDEADAQKSKITDTILAEIEQVLQSLKTNDKLKIAMCHHHPMKHSNMDYNDDDSLEKGDDFLRLLERFDFKLVVHGHKHDPRLNYSNSLPVLACGSFSSMQNLLDVGAQNTFHFIEMSKSNRRGTIRTWTYGPKTGWTQRLDSYFPSFTGFGARPSMDLLAKTCIDYINTKNEATVPYDELVSIIPDLEYLIPEEQEKLNDLVLVGDICFIPKLPNRPERVSKLYK
jgi:predicted phosphodiesterase